MGLFGQSTPFDADIEKATSETNTNENWSLILDVCDKVTTQPRNAKECLRAIMKRMAHTDPHVVMQAITLLDACASNCGKPFHLEIASREFENEFRRLMGKAQPKVSLKMRQVLKSWAEGDFKSDPQLNLIPSLYAKLRAEGHDFSNLGDNPPKSISKAAAAAAKDPNVVSSQQEEDDIAAAIELSLKESKSSPKSASANSTTTNSTTYPSLYPSFGSTGSGAIGTNSAPTTVSSQNNPPVEPRKVRALYDFEAAEENELTFYAGEIIHVVDDSDPNWWKGYNQRGEGLFPSNFVTADLSVDPEQLEINQQNKSAKKTVQFEDDARELQQKTEAAAAAAANQNVEVDETKIDRLLHLLHEANPEDPSQDTDEMLRLEQEVNQMGPLIDSELERVDRKHAQLTQLSSDLVDAINLYHSLMRDDRAALMSAGTFMPGMMSGSSNLGGYPMTNPQMMYGGYGPMSGNFSATQQIPNNFSLPYAAGQMPPTGSPYAAGNNPQMPPTSIPLQYQNGQMNGANFNGMPQQPIYAPLTQQPGAQLPTQQPTQLQAQPQQQQNSTSDMQASYQMFTQPQQQPQPQQQQHQQQSYAPQDQQQQLQQPPQTQVITTSNTAPMPTSTMTNHSQQPQPHFISPQHQPPPQQSQPQPQPQLNYMPPQQFAPMPNGPQSYMPHMANAAMGPSSMMQAPYVNGNSNPNGNGEPAYNLQQHLAAMSLHAGINQPVTQNFLVQNEPKNNIPIYQQQR